MENILKYNLALARGNYSEKYLTEELINLTNEYIDIAKIGFEQFIRFGSDIIEIVRKTGNKIFLYFKSHDIPSIVAKAIKVVYEHNLNYATVLISIYIYALNVELYIQSTINNQVSHFIKLAISKGLNGIVCSVADLVVVENNIPDTLEVITLGIRMTNDPCQDQKLIATPKQAIDNGATMLVVGRTVIASKKPMFFLQ